MKKIFEVVEVVTYRHEIEVEVADEQEEKYEEVAEQLYYEMENGMYYDEDQITQEFVDNFGKENVGFMKDTSPEVKFETI